MSLHNVSFMVQISVYFVISNSVCQEIFLQRVRCHSVEFIVIYDLVFLIDVFLLVSRRPFKKPSAVYMHGLSTSLRPPRVLLQRIIFFFPNKYMLSEVVHMDA